MGRPPKSEAVILAEALLREHYKEPVRPVSEYCNAFRTWANALREYAKEQEGDERADPRLLGIVEAAGDLEIAILKSNLLSRLIYGGEEIRTVKCPVHNGRWSGCAFGADLCEWCADGYNITGWVRPERVTDAQRATATP